MIDEHLSHHNLCFALIEVHCENSKLMFHLNLLLFKWTFSVCWKFGKLFIWKSQCFFQCWFWMLFDSANIESLKKQLLINWIITILLKLIVLSCLSTLLIHDFDIIGRRQFYTVLTYRRVVFLSCFLFLCQPHCGFQQNLNFGTNLVIFKNFPNFKTNT
jgi:hypothetical protein